MMTKIFTEPGPCSYNSSSYNTISSNLSKVMKKKKKRIKKSQSLGHFNTGESKKKKEMMMEALQNHRGYTAGPGAAVGARRTLGDARGRPARAGVDQALPG